MKILVLVLAVALTLTGCAARGSAATSTPSAPASTTLPTGSTDQELTVGGVARDYRVFVPSGLSTGSPLVIMLHGGFGSAQQAENSYGWDAEASAHRFVVAYPNGDGRAWNVGGGCCGAPGRTGVDDVAFISAVVADVEARASIDSARVFATGISNGGMMDYRLACDTTLFAAIAPESATLLGNCPSPHPLSVLHIHGLADQNIPFAGGEGDGFAKIDGPSVTSVVDRFATADGCPAAASTTTGPVTIRTATGCAGGRTVELITIAGAGHQWPGSTPRPGLEKVLGTDPPSTALNATDTIWAFFAATPA